MRLLFLAALTLLAVLPASAAPAPAAAADCQFVLGFSALAEVIPEVVGQCTTDVYYDPAGNGRQETTAWHGKGGLLFWRNADNWTGFTDGYHTWVVGPRGLDKRLNTERFAWESDRLVPRLRNAEYRLPFAVDPRGTEKEAIIRLTDGVYENRDQRVSVRLVEPFTALGDLNRDGVLDAVVVLAANLGGSGTSIYAVAMVDKDGQPVQAGYEYLGDRIKVNQIDIADGQTRVDMITQGPNDPFCCPTQRVVRPLSIQVPAAVPSLDGTSWILESLANASGTLEPMLPGSEVTAQFAVGQVSGKAGCNSYFAGYQADADSLKIVGPIGSTRMFCAIPEGLMAQEASYLTALASTSSYTTTGRRLEITNAAGQTILTFVGSD